MKEAIEMYKDIWNAFNLFGKIAFFPFLCLAFPMIVFFNLGFKE